LKLLEDSRIGNLNKEQKELIQNIKDDNKRLLKILSELLDLSQVESGKIQLNIQPVNVENIVQRAIEAIERSAKDKNISIAIDVENNLPTIHADAEKTSWVLINFLTNAIKYSKDNSTILLQVKQVENKVKFNVIDKGIGIAPEYLYKIFDRFFKVPNTTKKGSGLGLAISKEFIEAMGGQISAESILEEGSTFSFSLNK
jgi:signal transduction histidine kinase